MLSRFLTLDSKSVSFEVIRYFLRTMIPSLYSQISFENRKQIISAGIILKSCDMPSYFL